MCAFQVVRTHRSLLCKIHPPPSLPHPIFPSITLLLLVYLGNWCFIEAPPTEPQGQAVWETFSPTLSFFLQAVQLQRLIFDADKESIKNYYWKWNTKGRTIHVAQKSKKRVTFLSIWNRNARGGETATVKIELLIYGRLLQKGTSRLTCTKKPVRFFKKSPLWKTPKVAGKKRRRRTLPYFSAPQRVGGGGEDFMTNDLLRFSSAAGRVEEEEEERGGKSILGPYSTSHIRSVKKRSVKIRKRC